MGSHWPSHLAEVVSSRAGERQDKVDSDGGSHLWLLEYLYTRMSTHAHTTKEEKAKEREVLGESKHVLRLTCSWSFPPTLYKVVLKVLFTVIRRMAGKTAVMSHLSLCMEDRDRDS